MWSIRGMLSCQGGGVEVGGGVVGGAVGGVIQVGKWVFWQCQYFGSANFLAGVFLAVPILGKIYVNFWQWQFWQLPKKLPIFSNDS